MRTAPATPAASGCRIVQQSTHHVRPDAALRVQHQVPVRSVGARGDEKVRVQRLVVHLGTRVTSMLTRLTECQHEKKQVAKKTFPSIFIGVFGCCNHVRGEDSLPFLNFASRARLHQDRDIHSHRRVATHIAIPQLPAYVLVRRGAAAKSSMSGADVVATDECDA